MTSALQLHWIKNTKGEWLPIERVDLSNVATFGVYIIWHGGLTPRIVRVGQGDIADRLSAHREDREILAYRNHGALYVTWAAVSARLVDGVERHLANHWSPLVGDRFPNAAPVEVNAPFAA